MFIICKCFILVSENNVLANVCIALYPTLNIFLLNTCKGCWHIVKPWPQQTDNWRYEYAHKRMRIPIFESSRSPWPPGILPMIFLTPKLWLNIGHGCLWKQYINLSPIMRPNKAQRKGVDDMTNQTGNKKTQPRTWSSMRTQNAPRYETFRNIR